MALIDEKPAEADYFLDLFYEIQKGRQYTMAGALPLTWGCFTEWQEFFQRELSQYEIMVINVIDGVFLSTYNPKG